MAEEKGLLGTMDDVALQPELQKIVDMVESQVENQEVFNRILTAGKKVMFDPKLSKKLMEGVADAKDVPHTVGQGIAGIVMTLKKQSRGTMPEVEMAQAATVMLMEALDALTKVGLFELAPGAVDSATMAMSEALLGSLGVTKERMGALMGNVEGVMKDPEKMKAYEAHRSKGAAPAAPAPAAPAPAPAQGGPNGL